MVSGLMEANRGSPWSFKRMRSKTEKKHDRKFANENINHDPNNKSEHRGKYRPCETSDTIFRRISYKMYRAAKNGVLLHKRYLNNEQP